MKIKSFLMISFIAALVTLLVAKATFSNPVLPDTQPQGSINLNIDDPVCYMQTEDGTVLDLSNLCGKEQLSRPTSTARTYAQQPQVYNVKKLKEFDDSLYGPEN
ncbi:MAG: hypothetical protein RID09_10305 [Coleofasciculus sp. G1-WW12-02]|uniref:hypothetical protein n=1 Tax=unclassified Coleofasciculus TaxID=2692782 RepID=UPI0032FDCC34